MNNAFTVVGHYDNSNEIDGTPGCPPVQIMGTYYRCSQAMSDLVAKLALFGQSGDVNYLQVNVDSHPDITTRFTKEMPDERYEFLVFKPGRKTTRWYCSTVAF